MVMVVVVALLLLLCLAPPAGLPGADVPMPWSSTSRAGLLLLPVAVRCRRPSAPPPPSTG